MKLLFVHTAERAKEDDKGNLYTDGSYNPEVWDRYLSISNNLCVIFRKDPIKYDPEYAKKAFNPLKAGISLIEVKDRTASLKEYLSIKNIRHNRNIIEKAVANCDLLIVRGGNYTAVKYANKYNKPYLVEVVGCPWDSLWNHSFKGKILALNGYLKMRKIVKNAPFALYVTNEFLQRRYPCNGYSIGCSDVVLPILDEKILEKRLNKITNMNRNEPIVIGTLGAVDVPYKGHHYVIKAIAKLNQCGYDFEYHLVGGGDTARLRYIAEKYKVENKVKFLGSLSHKQVFNFLDSIDVYIQPSKTEGLPRSLVEAMSRACPALGSSVGGIPELLNNEYVFRKASVNQICSFLIKMDKKMLINAAKSNFNKAKEYQKDILDKKRNDFYKEFARVSYNHDIS